jgi:hypothetical protein
MQLQEFIRKNNILVNEKERKDFERITNKKAKKVMGNIYNALCKYNASKSLICKVLGNTYTWYSLLKNVEQEIADFVNTEGKLDESGLYYWLITD